VSQNNNLACHVEERKKLSSLISSNNQSMHLQAHVEYGMKTARPGVDYSSH